MKPVYDGDKFVYCVGARTAIGIESPNALSFICLRGPARLYWYNFAAIITP